MRRGRDGGLVRCEDGRLLGVFLGTDGCAEHECGIKGLRYDFGINIADDDRSVLGVERRKITSIPKKLILIKDPKPLIKKEYDQGFREGQNVLYCDRIYSSDEKPRLDQVMTTAYKGTPQLDVQGAWDENSFALAADKKIIAELQAAFEALDIMMMVGAAGVFGGGPGLSFAIFSRIPQETKDAQKAADEERFWLKDWEQATGVREKIHASDKISRGSWGRLGNGTGNKGSAYFSLSAKKFQDGKVMWWLNPFDQHNNSWGWYTTEDLEQWCEGRGPVVENSRAAKGEPKL